MNFRQTIAILVFALGFGTAAPAAASDIFIGAKGPTLWQADERVAFSRNEKDLETLTNTFILKVWSGDTKGMWGFVNVPYKHLASPDASNSGLGDMTIGGEPRGRYGNLHWMAYGSLSLPTGETNSTLPLGTGRYDLSGGAFLTCTTPDKKLEVDASASYTATGENKKDINPPDYSNLGGYCRRRCLQENKICSWCNNAAV